MEDRKRPTEEAKESKEGDRNMAIKTVDREEIRRGKARELVAYLSYAVEDLRQVSPASSHLLEMSIAAINEDMQLPQPHGAGEC
jgi:hypothetical protein